MSARGRTVLALVAILALGAALRIASAGGFWIDEVFSAANARAGPATFLARLQGEPHSPWPIYYLLLGGWQRLFPSVEGMKALSVLLSLAQVLVLFGLARFLCGRRAALLAALLAAANPLLAWYGGEIRMYALTLLLLTGAIWAALRAIASRRARDGLLFALLAGLSVYAHVLAAFPVAVLALLVLVRGGRDAAWAAIALGTAVALPAVLIVWDQAGHWLSWKAGVAEGYVVSPLNLVAAAQAFFTAYAAPLGGHGAVRLAALAAVAGLVGFPLVLAVARRAPARWLLLALVAVGLVAPYLLMVRTRMYSPRFALIALPPLLLLVAAGIETLRPGRAALLVGLIGLLGVVSVGFRSGRTDWREVAALLERERRPGEYLGFEGGNRAALEEWFGDAFRGGSLLGLEAFYEMSHPGYWFVRVTPPDPGISKPEGLEEEVRHPGPARHLVEDEPPWIVHWSAR